MVTYETTDVIPMTEFAFAWRITDPRWAVLREDALRRFKPLGLARSTQVFNACAAFGRVPYPCDPRNYHAVSRESLEENESSDSQRIHSWLRALPIPPDSEVYLCWASQQGVAAVTDWANLIDNWSDLWYPFDLLCILDDTLDWAMILGPEEEAYFIQRNAVKANATSRDFSRPLMTSDRDQIAGI